MSLIAPTPGVDPGPDYANNQNQSFVIIDGHNHGPGSGVQITPNGLNLNTNVNFFGNSPYNVYSVIFSNPAANSALTNLYTNYQSGGGIVDLFFNDGAGNVIALTKAGEVNATIASLPGESYAGGTFTWKQGAGSTTPANFDIGSITIRPNTAGTTNGVVLGPPTGISSQYNVYLPTVPVQTNVMTLDASGNMSSVTFDAVGQTMTSVGANAIAETMTVVGADAIAATMDSTGTNSLIATMGAAGANQLRSNMTKALGNPSVGVGGVVTSSSCGVFPITSSSYTPVTNLSVTITTSGKPVRVFLSSAATPSFLITSYVPGSSNVFVVQAGLRCLSGASVFFDATIGGSFYMQASSNLYVVNGPDILDCLDTSVNGTPGTYTYSVELANLGQGTTTLQNMALNAYEIT